MHRSCWTQDPWRLLPPSEAWRRKGTRPSCLRWGEVPWSRPRGPGRPRAPVLWEPQDDWGGRAGPLRDRRPWNAAGQAATLASRLSFPSPESDSMSSSLWSVPPNWQPESKSPFAGSSSELAGSSCVSPPCGASSSEAPTESCSSSELRTAWGSPLKSEVPLASPRALDAGTEVGRCDCG